MLGKRWGNLVRHPGHHGQLLKVEVRIHGGGSSQHLPDPNAHLWDILTGLLVGAGQAVGISTILLPWAVLDIPVVKPMLLYVTPVVTSITHH